MADETETVAETTETTEATEPVVEEKAHPLQPGGVRFEEVVREKNTYKAETESLRERLARLEGQMAATRESTPAQPATQFYTPEQLQAAVDTAKITPAQMAAQLAWQAKETAKREMKTEFAADQRRGSALSEVNQYIEKIPALGNQSSQEFAKVRRSAFEIADEMGLDVTDPRVQRRALRETFGTLDRVAQTTRLRDFDRQHADTSIETQGGGGGRTQAADPLKNVPKALMDHWKSRGYSTEQMNKELAYVDLDRWKRRG